MKSKYEKYYLILRDNLDAMTLDDLESVGFAPLDVRATAAARTVFPERPQGFIRAFHSLRNYAANKAVAMRARARGDISIALQYEQICDRIYANLPEFARFF